MRKPGLVDVHIVRNCNSYCSPLLIVRERYDASNGTELGDAFVGSSMLSDIYRCPNGGVAGKAHAGAGCEDVIVGKVLIFANFVQEDGFGKIEFACNLLLLYLCKFIAERGRDSDDGKGISNKAGSGEDVDCRE